MKSSEIQCALFWDGSCICYFISHKCSGYFYQISFFFLFPLRKYYLHVLSHCTLFPTFYFYQNVEEKRLIKAQLRKRSMTNLNLFPQSRNIKNAVNAAPFSGLQHSSRLTEEVSSTYLTSFCRVFCLPFFQSFLSTYLIFVILHFFSFPSYIQCWYFYSTFLPKRMRLLKISILTSSRNFKILSQR